MFVMRCKASLSLLCQLVENEANALHMTSGATDTGGFVRLSSGASKAHSLLLYMAMMSGKHSFR